MSDSDDLNTNFVEDIVRTYKVPIVLGLVGVVLVIVGVGVLFRQPKGAVEFRTNDTASSSASAREIVIDVSGAVETPGVYRLPGESRVGDVIDVAGGFVDTADGDWIARNLNLAGRVTDGAKIYIPSLGEVVTSGQTAGVTSDGIVGSGKSTININAAQASELEKLPGIGPVTAGKIIDNRPYTTIEDLLSKDAVNKGQMEKIKDQVSVF